MVVTASLQVDNYFITSLNTRVDYCQQLGQSTAASTLNINVRLAPDCAITGQEARGYFKQSLTLDNC